MKLYFIINRKIAVSWSVCVVDVYVNMKDRVLARQTLQRRMTSELPLATSSRNQTMVGQRCCFRSDAEAHMDHSWFNLAKQSS